MFFWRKSTYYNSIDNCPIQVFHECMSGNGFDKLLIKGKLDIAKAFESWKGIFNEFIKEYGLPENFISYINERRKALSYYIKRINSGRTTYMLHAKASEEVARQIIDVGDKQKFEVMVAQVSKNMGYRIDPMKTSVREFYGIIEMIKNGK